MNSNRVKTGWEPVNTLVIESCVTFGKVLPPCESQLQHTVVTMARKGCVRLTHTSCQKLQLEYQINQKWSGWDQNGYVQVYTLVFGKHNKLGVSLPPAESPSIDWWNPEWLHSVHRLNINLAGPKTTAGITIYSPQNLTQYQHVQHMHTL